MVSRPLAYVRGGHQVQHVLFVGQKYGTRSNYNKLAVADNVFAFLTVSWQAIRAAMANPVDSLRDE